MTPLATSWVQSESFIYVLYIIAFALFIQGLRGLAGPTTAVRGNRIAAVGMAIAVVATLLEPERGGVGADRPRDRDRGSRRRACGAPGEDDRDAADGGAVQRRRRRRGVPDRLGGVPPPRLDLRLAHDPHHRAVRHAHDQRRRRRDVHRGLLRVRGDRRLDLLLGLEHRLRKAPGNPSRPPDHTRRGAADRQPRPAGARPRGRHRPLRGGSLRSALHRHARLRGPARQLPGAADRRRRHAGRDLAAERLHRPLGGCDRDRAEQPCADRRGHDRRRLGHDPHEPDGPGDEPLDPRDRRGRLRRRRRDRGRRRRGRARRHASNR